MERKLSRVMYTLRGGFLVLLGVLFLFFIWLLPGVAKGGAVISPA